MTNLCQPQHSESSCCIKKLFVGSILNSANIIVIVTLQKYFVSTTDIHYTTVQRNRKDHSRESQEQRGRIGKAKLFVQIMCKNNECAVHGGKLYIINKIQPDNETSMHVSL